MKKNLLFLLETGQSKKIIKNMSLVVTCNLYPIMTITKIKKHMKNTFLIIKTYHFYVLSGHKIPSADAWLQLPLNQIIFKLMHSVFGTILPMSLKLLSITFCEP